MEPVRTKQRVVLAMVFSLALGIMLGCTPKQSEKPLEPEKTDSSSAPDEKPSPPEAKKVEKATGQPAEVPTTEEPQALAEGAEQEPEPLDEFDFPQDETVAETARRLGPPLVEQPEKLQPLDKAAPIWLDKNGKRLIMVGEVCQQRAPLEMFVCLWHTKEHESVLTARVPAKSAHAGLLLLGAEVGSPVQFMPEYKPASGTEIDIDVIWKDADGKIQQNSAKQWIRNVRTKKPMEESWVFAGSGFWEDKTSGRSHYMAEGGDFICVSNFSTAMLDLPIESTQQREGLLFEALTENIPPLGTPVTIVLKPRLGKNTE